jgi:hypothetical protein
LFDGRQWSELKLEKQIAQCILYPRRIIGIVEEPFLESFAEFKRRLGIERIRRPKPAPGEKRSEIVIREEEAVKRRELERVLVESRWRGLLEPLRAEGRIVFTKNEHFGKLRGSSIAKKMHADLKRIGIETSLKFQSEGAIVEVLK